MVSITVQHSLNDPFTRGSKNSYIVLKTVTDLTSKHLYLSNRRFNAF